MNNPPLAPMVIADVRLRRLEILPTPNRDSVAFEHYPDSGPSSVRVFSYDQVRGIRDYLSAIIEEKESQDAHHESSSDGEVNAPEAGPLEPGQ